MKAFLFLLLVGSMPVDAATLAGVEISGLQRFTASDIESFLQLSNGKNVATADLDKSCQRLLDSGVVASCEFSYKEADAGSLRLNLKLTEVPADRDVQIAIAGQQSAAFWNWAATHERLAKKRMPSNDAAIAFYSSAMEKFISAGSTPAALTGAVEDDMQTRVITFSFRPANQITIADVKVEGVRSIPQDQVESTLRKAAAGAGYTDFDFRKLLAETVTPIFEKAGHLGIQYPEVKTEKTASGGVLVKVQVEEGPVYSIQGLKVSGLSPDEEAAARASFPSSGIADWEKVNAVAADVLKRQKSRGHLAASYTLDRQLSANAEAQIIANFKLGPVSTFGELTIAGLSSAVEARVRKLWKLAKGDPMNENYVDEFQDAVFAQLGKEFTRGSASMSNVPGTSVMNVLVTFGSGRVSKDR